MNEPTVDGCVRNTLNCDHSVLEEPLQLVEEKARSCWIFGVTGATRCADEVLDEPPERP